MTLFTRCKHFICLSLLLILTGALPANAMTQDEFNALFIGKGCSQITGCQEAVDEVSRQRVTLKEIVQMARDPKLEEFQYCILVGVTVSALTEGISPRAIVQIFKGIEGLNPTVYLASMVRAGITEEEVRDVAMLAGIPEIVIDQAFSRAKVADICSINEDTLAYTAEEGQTETVIIGGDPVVTREDFISVSIIIPFVDDDVLAYTPAEDEVLPYSSPSMFDEPEKDEVLPYSSPSIFEVNVPE
ncbi:MAG: hypothetical protein KKD63_16440 [Proteobacteria bacterium]|nr:hypothetical protein [Desulfobulbaceae bacterium]MBU4154460.1 hypothetical protein [Pseudomonadota bacterium]